MKLLFISLSGTDAYHNLAIEKKLLSIDEDHFILRFWINSPSVILGKFQNRKYEVNHEFVQALNIPVLHRFTGGGTVYHDLGNLNISFCKSRKKNLNCGPGMTEKRCLTETIRDAIAWDNLDLIVDERNAIFSDDKKILGSAVAITNGKFMYQASLLINANLDNLYQSINWNPNYPRKNGKFVRSKRDKVTNLSQIYPITMDRVKFRIFNYMKNVINPDQTIFITDENQLDYFMN